MYARTFRRRNEDVVRAMLGKPVATSTCLKKPIKKGLHCVADHIPCVVMCETCKGMLEKKIAVANEV